jgi:hypothetical protein
MVSPLLRLAIVKVQAVYLSFEVYKNGVYSSIANGRGKAKLGGQERRGRREERSRGGKQSKQRGDESRGEERRGEEEKKKKRELANPVHW